MTQQKPDNDWVANLSATGNAQEESLSELRLLLLKRVQRAFRSNPQVNDALLEDAVQDSLLAILKNLKDFRGNSQFTTWCTTIAVRIVISELRRRRWKDVSLEGLQQSQTVDNRMKTSDPGVESELERSQIIKTLRRVIAEQLTDKQRTVLEAELSGMPQSEIGRCLGSTRNAIYKVGHDARKKLKQGMLEAGYSAEDLELFVGAAQ